MVDLGQDVPPATSFGEACASIARVVAESLDLDQVIDPMAAAVRMIVPFDGMGVWHADAPDDPVRLTLGPSPDMRNRRHRAAHGLGGVRADRRRAEDGLAGQGGPAGREGSHSHGPDREPLQLETSMPGAIAVRSIWDYLEKV